MVFFLSVGALFFLIGTIALLRFPDVYTRLHGATKCDTLGLGLILAGLMLH
ncbi:monovalent cation/H(+) antiporter subunit G, partial [Dehalococcoidia bacterium]|nr:monovalent cation/H(+) antiporter subunit G [Dehalococcoidia bacterium]